MKILITGAAGFIGSNLCMELVKNKKFKIVGIDNLNDYYDVNLKKDRLKKIIKDSKKNFKFLKVDISNEKKLFALFKKFRFEIVINLAAQAGVRYSLENPLEYINSNIVGFANILENCRNHNVNHLVYASTSSVYGANTKMPFSEHHSSNHPLSVYAASKKSNELMAHSYSHLYGIPTTGLRFFTVYGPYGRPDMAYYKFVKAMIKGESIDLYNNGNMKRDFTYITDIIEGVVRVIDIIPTPKNNKISRISPPYQLYNIGNNNPISLRRFISSIEDSAGVSAKENLMPMQLGDVPETHADIDELIHDIGFKPTVSIEEGIGKFVHWYEEIGKHLDDN